MNRKKCMHNNIFVDELAEDMIGTCEECGGNIFISHIKSGLYVIEYNNKVYILNTITDMDLENSPYSFEIDGNNICLHKTLTNEHKSGSARQLCKKKGN